MLSTLYAAIARRRREWYAARPEARRRLRHPVISIGNIAAGGRGKTPFTATIARLLLDMGERPAILSRGYGRTDPVEGAVVVRDAQGIRADLARSGDEPLMLARQLEGAIVMSGADRYLSGRLAEHHLGATVHLLDDGFQHFALDRDLDIVLVSAADLNGAKTLPAGRLREPADVLIAADAIVCTDVDTTISVPDIPVFRAVRTIGDCGIRRDRTAAASCRCHRARHRWYREPRALLRGAGAGGMAGGRDDDVPGSPPVHGRRRRAIRECHHGGRWSSGYHHGKGLRPPAAVPAVPARDRVAAAYNHCRARRRLPPMARGRSRGRTRYRHWLTSTFPCVIVLNTSPSPP